MEEAANSPPDSEVMNLLVVSILENLWGEEVYEQMKARFGLNLRKLVLIAEDGYGGYVISALLGEAPEFERVYEDRVRESYTSTAVVLEDYARFLRDAYRLSTGGSADSRRSAEIFKRGLAAVEKIMGSHRDYPDVQRRIVGPFLKCLLAGDASGEIRKRLGPHLRGGLGMIERTAGGSGPAES